MGMGLRRNQEEAFKWYTLAAEQGHPGAKTNLENMLRGGKYVPKQKDVTAGQERMACKGHCKVSETGENVCTGKCNAVEAQ